MNSKALQQWSGLAIGLVACGAAFGSICNGFTWDDRAAVLENPDARVDSENTPANPLFHAFLDDFWGAPIRSERSHKSFRPITVLSFRLNNWLNGFDASYYHLVNLAVHVATSLLVWQVTRLCFHQFSVRRQPPKAKEASHIASLVAGLLFAVHPIHCDAVASIVGRADLLATCFSLLGFLLYLQASTPSGATDWRRFVLALACVVLATLSKELGFTTIGLFVAVDMIRFAAADHSATNRSSSAMQNWLVRLGALILFSVPAACLRVWVNGEYHHHHWHYLANHIARQPNSIAKLLSYAHVHSWYLWKLLWPCTLCFDYGFSSIPMVTSLRDPLNLLTFAAYAIVLGGTLYALTQLRKSPLLLLFIFFGLIPFVPASHIIFPVGTILAERLLYFPSVGFCTLCAWVFQRMLVRAKELKDCQNSSPYQRLFFKTCYRFIWVSVGLLTCAGMVRSHMRNRDWQSEHHLFESAVRVNPRNVKVLSNLAKDVLNQDPDRAIQHASIALGLYPQQVEGHINLGLAYSVKLDQLNAVTHLLKAVTYGSNEFTSLGYLGKELFVLWTHDKATRGFTRQQFRTSPTIYKAKSYLDQAIAQNTFHPCHFQARGLIAYHSGEFDEALDFFHATNVANDYVRTRNYDLELVLPDSDMLSMIGATYQSMGRMDLALQNFVEGMRRFPDHMDFYANTAILYKQQNETLKCEELMHEAIGDDVVDPDVEQENHHQHDHSARKRWRRMKPRDFIRIGSALEQNDLEHYALTFYMKALALQPLSQEYRVWLEQKVAALRRNPYKLA